MMAFLENLLNVSVTDTEVARSLLVTYHVVHGLAHSSRLSETLLLVNLTLGRGEVAETENFKLALSRTCYEELRLLTNLHSLHHRVE